MTADRDPIAAVTSQNPHGTYDRLCAQGPFLWFAPRRTWLTTTDAAARAVLAHPDARVRPHREPVPPTLAGTLAGEVFGRLVRMRDGDRHHLAKTAIQRALETIDLDRVRAESARQAETIDLNDPTALSSIAFTLPVHVIGWLLGVPASRLDRLPFLVRDFARCIGPAPSDATIAPGVAAVAELSSWFDALLPNATPPALLGSLREAFAGAGIDEPGNVTANAIGLLFQAYDATAGLLASTILDVACSAPIPSDVSAVETVVRRVLTADAPIQNTRRFANVDTVMHGQRVQAGDPILVVLASASRDPDASGLALGSGPHSCPGGELAIAIVSATVSTLIDRGVLDATARDVAYLDSPNARVPLLDGMSLRCPIAHGGDDR